MAGYVYLMTNQYNTVFYAGVTSNLQKRVYEHRNGITGGFTSKYKTHKLVYCEIFDDMENAILREKQIKAGSRKKKLELILKMNPDFKDLSVAWEIASSACGGLAMTVRQ